VKPPAKHRYVAAGLCVIVAELAVAFRQTTKNPAKMPGFDGVMAAAKTP
jgi:hypothetical protein